MAKQNRGKQFEEQIRIAFDKCKDTFIMRLIDPQSGYAGVHNICDFVAYRKPNMYLIECKSCYGNTLPFTNITPNQLSGLANACAISGVVAGFMVWFIDHDKTFFIPVDRIVQEKSNGYKSINIKDADDWGIEIRGIKKRVLFDYELEEFFSSWEWRNYV